MDVLFLILKERQYLFFNNRLLEIKPAETLFEPNFYFKQTLLQILNLLGTHGLIKFASVSHHLFGRITDIFYCSHCLFILMAQCLTQSFQFIKIVLHFTQNFAALFFVDSLLFSHCHLHLPFQQTQRLDVSQFVHFIEFF